MIQQQKSLASMPPLRPIMARDEQVIHTIGGKLFNYDNKYPGDIHMCSLYNQHRPSQRQI